MVVIKKDYRDQMDFDNKVKSIFGKGHDLERLSLTNVYLDEKYEVLTNDLMLANKILQPRILDRFIEVNKDLNKEISIGIANGKLLILTEQKHNLFDIYLSDHFQAEIIWDEIMEIFKTIEYVEEIGIDYTQI